MGYFAMYDCIPDSYLAKCFIFLMHMKCLRMLKDLVATNHETNDYFLLFEYVVFIMKNIRV